MGKPKGIGRRIPRKPGAIVQYSPEQRDRYLSLQPRIEKAYQLVDLIQEIPSDNKERTLYFFPSDRAPSPPGGWTVVVEEQPPKRPPKPSDPLIPLPPGELPTQDTWGKSRAVFVAWSRFAYPWDADGVTLAGSPFVSVGSGLPPLINQTDSTVNNWRRMFDPLPADSPPYPRPVASAALLNEQYAGDVEKMLPFDYGGSFINGIGARFGSQTIFSTPDADGLSLNQLDAARIPYLVGAETWYSGYDQRPIGVGGEFGTERARLETYDLYLLRYVGEPGTTPESFSFQNSPWRRMVSRSGLIRTRDTPLDLAGDTLADIWALGGLKPAIAARIPVRDAGVSPVRFDQPYSPSSPIVPDQPVTPDSPDVDPSEPDQPQDPELPIDPQRASYSCNCPDNSRIELMDPASPFESRWRDRVWTDSRAGAPVYAVEGGEIVYCKHVLAAMLKRGDPLP